MAKFSYFDERNPSDRWTNSVIHSVIDIDNKNELMKQNPIEFYFENLGIINDKDEELQVDYDEPERQENLFY